MQLILNSLKYLYRFQVTLIAVKVAVFLVGRIMKRVLRDDVYRVAHMVVEKVLLTSNWTIPLTNEALGQLQ